MMRPLLSFLLVGIVLPIPVSALRGNGGLSELVVYRSVPGVDQTEAAVPVNAASVQSHPLTRKVTFVLQNNSAKAVTAWKVDITVGSAAEAATVGHGTDAYRAFAGLGPGATFLLPGGTAVATADMPSQANPNAATVIVTPTSVVFADKSFAGDPAFAEFVFQHRAEERAALLSVLNDLEESAKTGPSIEALEGVQTRLDAALVQKPFDPIRAQLVKPSLVALIRDVRERRTSAATGFNLLLEEVRRYAAAAVAHAR